MNDYGAIVITYLLLYYAVYFELSTLFVTSGFVAVQFRRHSRRRGHTRTECRCGDFKSEARIRKVDTAKVVVDSFGSRLECRPAAAPWRVARIMCRRCV